MRLFKTLLFTFCVGLITNTYALTEAGVLRIDGCASGEKNKCGKILVGAALVEKETIQWVGPPKAEVKRACGSNAVKAGISVCTDGTVPVVKAIEEPVEDILESLYISLGTFDFGITGNKLYRANMRKTSNRWSFETTALARIIIEGTKTSPSIGFFFAPTKVGILSGGISYDLSTTRKDGLTANGTIIDKTSIGEGVLDGSGDNTIITLQVDIDDKYISSDCIGIPGCKEITISVGDTVNFTVNTNVNQQLLQAAGLDENFHKHAKILAFVDEINNVCPYSTIENSKQPQVSDINNYYDYLNGFNPNVPLAGCNRTYNYLMSVDKDFTILTSRNVKDLGEGGYIDYTFYAEGHYDLVNPEKTIGWAGKGYQTYRIRTQQEEKPVAPFEAKITATQNTGFAPLTVSLNASNSIIEGHDPSYKWSLLDSTNNFIKEIGNDSITSTILEEAGDYIIQLEMVSKIPNQSSKIDKLNVKVSSSPKLPTNLMISPIQLNDNYLKTLIGTKLILGNDTLILKAVADDENIVSLDLPPVACFEVESVTEYAPSEVTLDATCSYDLENGITTYNWLLPNKAECNSNICETVFEEAGNHDIALTITDNNGNTSKTTRNVFVAQPLQQTMSIYNLSGDSTSYSIGELSEDTLFYETILVNGKLTKEFSDDDHVDITVTIVPTENQDRVQLLLAKAIDQPEKIAFFSEHIFDQWDKFPETQNSEFSFVKDQPQHIHVFSGKDILTDFGIGILDKDTKIDIYVGYQLGDGEKVFNTTPISLIYTAPILF